MTRSCWLGLALLSLLLARPALADDAAEAKARFNSGLKHFDLAEYAQALSDFKEAYRLRDDPVFLYNIAQCHRLLNDNAEAITFYRNYLRRAPNARNRAEVEAKIATLKQALETQERASRMPPNHVLGNEGNEAGNAPPPSTSTPPPATNGEAGQGSSNALTAQAPPPKKPVYKQWWLWTAVGAVVVAGVAVGVGVGVGTSHAANPFPLVNF